MGDEPPQGEIDAFKPENKEDFEKFKDMLHKKISQSEVSSRYFVIVVLQSWR